MSIRRRIASLDLAMLLLVLATAEITLRLTLPVLGASSDPRLPRWFSVAGVFMLHLTSVLALGACVHGLFGIALRKDFYPPGLRFPLTVIAVPLLVLSGWSIFATTPAWLTFFLEGAFVAFFMAVVVAAGFHRGDPLVKVGLALLALPFVLHFYGTLRLQSFVGGSQVRFSSLPDRVRELGQWSLAAAALLTPVCLAPRPLLRSFGRPGPLVAAAFVGTVGAVIMQRHYAEGMELASRALGIDLGPGAPIGTIAVYVTAAAMVAWTLATTVTAEASSRRLIGLGFALVVACGYSFAMPVQFLCAAVGALAIATGAAFVVEEESASQPPRFTSPEIAEEVWSSYVAELGRAVFAEPALERDGELETTRLAGNRLGLPFQLRIVRSQRGIHTIEAWFGQTPDQGAPSWTLFARPEALLATGVHPAPPASTGPAVKTGDPAFDRRFRIHDADKLTARLLDEGLRARAAAVLDGWIAAWPGRALHYKVCPGRGAPLDHPVPVTELAFRGAASPNATDRMVSVLDLCAELATRVMAEPQAFAEGPK